MDDLAFLYRGWEPIARIVVIGLAGYVTLLLLVRVGGQRTLAQLTPFDVLITVTLGSAFGRVLTAENVGLAEVFAVLALLVALQWLVALLRERVPPVARLLRPPAILLVYRGEPDRRAMRRQRVTEEDLSVAARESGLGTLDDVHAMVLEADGALSVVPSGQQGDGAALPVPG